MMIPAFFFLIGDCMQQNYCGHPSALSGVFGHGFSGAEYTRLSFGYIRKKDLGILVILVMASVISLSLSKRLAIICFCFGLVAGPVQIRSSDMAWTGSWLQDTALYPMTR